MTEQHISAELLQEFHPALNNDLDPRSLSPGSNKKVWWQCLEHQHQWQAVVWSRTKGSKCPYCANSKVLAGFNDLATTHPAIAALWHSGSKPGMTPATVTAGSGAQATWQCSEHNDHQWTTTIASLTRGSQCPYCTNKKVLTGFNDLATTHPAIASQWDTAQNPKHTAFNVVAGSSAKVRWHCTDCDHRWTTTVASRTSTEHGTGCPGCSGNTVVPGVNDLATTHPELALQWHPDKNSTLTPADVTYGSNTAAWWLCDANPEHQWQAAISNRTGNKSKCPFCATKRAHAGSTDLATTHPHVAAIWHPSKNGELTAQMVTRGSARTVWWLCPEDQHAWQAQVKNVAKQTATGSCPVCAGRTVMTGVNDVGTLLPELMKQWHPVKNLPLTPQQLTVGSHQRVWWQCPDVAQHSWQTRVFDRSYHLTQCPLCFGRDSLAERKLADAVEMLLPGRTVLRNQRGLLAERRLELDLWIPELNTAIEFNGLYWHSEPGGFDQHRHAIKLQACRDAGVRLIAVWEDDWRDRPEIVLRGLAHKLNASGQLPAVLPTAPIWPKTGARALKVASVDTPAAKAFLDAHHIQGDATAGLRLALVDSSDAIRALLAVKSRGRSEPGTFEITRYATAGTIPGGFTKLMKHAERALGEGLRKWVTFADLAISDGSLYENSGFAADAVLPPDYAYLVANTRREHKSNYRLQRFRTDPGLHFDEHLTEAELARVNNLDRIWDYGKIRYVKQIA